MDRTVSFCETLQNHVAFNYNLTLFNCYEPIINTGNFSIL